MDREYLSQGYYYPQISISLRNLGRSALDIFHQAEKQATVNILETTIIFTAYLLAGNNAGNKKLLKIPSLGMVGREKMPGLGPFPAPPIF